MKDVKQKICEFDESIVSYMYDEMPAVERERFEAHLLDCTACTDEFAAIANARYGVYEWNKEEFAHIQTPRFVIPYNEPIADVSFFAKVRQAFQFGFGWLPTGSALAAVAIVLGIGYFAFTGNEGGQQIAGLNDNESRTAVAQTPTIPSVSVEKPLVGTGNERIADESGPKTAKVVMVPAKVMRIVTKRNFITPQQAKFAGTNARRSNAPRLSNVSDDEDQTLRLSELLDVVDSSE